MKRRSSETEDPKDLLRKIQLTLDQAQGIAGENPQMMALLRDVAGQLKVFDQQLADKSAQENNDDIIFMMKLIAEILVILAR